MVQHGRENGHTPPWLPDELSFRPTPEELPEFRSSKLPPTPISPTSSILQKDPEVAENGKPLVESGINSVTQALRNLIMSKKSLGFKTRRHQSLPVSSITTNPVLAAHLSNPTTSPTTTAQKSPDVPSPGHSDKLPNSKSFQELSKLTSDATPESRLKATPPHTPRALSHEGGPTEKRSPLSSTKTSSSNDGVTSEPEKPAKTSNGYPHASGSLPVNSLKGKLAVQIAEAKNLSPSYDPYVVCVFEWNEYISNGPKHDAMDIDEDEKSSKKGRKEILSAIPIRRTDSDMGKPMAIPMKSRQSSNNSNMDGHDQRNGPVVTNPRWDHEAML